MIVLRDPHYLTQIVQPDIKTYLKQRFHDLCDPEPYDPDEHGFFILVEPGDTSEQIEQATGYSLLKSLFSDTVYGEPDFIPDFEYLEDHGSFYESVYLFTDSGCAVIWIVPKEEGIDDRILTLCAEFSTQTMSHNPHPEPLNSAVATFVKGLDSNTREYFEERAAIAEFEANMPRADAEQFALELTRTHFNLQ